MKSVDKKFSLVQAPVMSFFNKDFYADIVLNGKGCGALYLFLLSTVAWLASCVAFFVPPVIQVTTNKDISAYLAGFPHLTIDDGKLSMKEKSPFQFKDPKSGIVFGVIDLERKTPPELSDDDPPIVVTSEGLFTNESSSSVKTTSSSGEERKSLLFAELNKTMGKVQLDGDLIMQGINTACFWIPTLCFFIGWPLVYAGHLIALLIYGAITMAISSSMEKKLPFETSMRLAAIAMTPTVVISAALTPIAPTFSPLGSIWAFISIGVAIAYIFVGLKAVPNEVEAR